MKKYIERKLLKTRFLINLKFRNLSLRDKIRLVIVITGLNSGILFTDYQEIAKLFEKRIIYIEIVQADGVTGESQREDTGSQVKQTGREVIETSLSGKSTESTTEKAGIDDISRKYGLNKENINKISQEVKKISDEMNFDWRIVMAIMLTESKGGLKMVGDNGLSKGYYHIYHVNVCELNGNKPNCIKDADRSNLEASTRWTINRLKRHAVLGEWEMIRSHNGLIADKSNNWYPEYVLKLTKEL